VGAEPASLVIAQDSESAVSLDDHSLSENELVGRAKKGDRGAMDELFRRHYQRAYALAYTLCSGDGEEAKDAIQDAFIKAFRNFGKFKEGATFYTWFYRILVNTCIDRKRKLGRWKRLFSFWPTSGFGDDSEQHDMEAEDRRGSSNPLEKLESREVGEKIRNAIMELPETQRVAFYLRVNEGMKVKEIAHVMGSAEGTAKTHLFRAIRSLQKKLKDLPVG